MCFISISITVMKGTEDSMALNSLCEESFVLGPEAGGSIRALGWMEKGGALTRVIISNPLGDFYFKYRFLCPCGI